MRTSILILSALALSAGVASADRGRGGGDHRAPAVSSGGSRGGNWNAGSRGGNSNAGSRGGNSNAGNRGGNWNAGSNAGNRGGNWNAGNQRTWNGGDRDRGSRGFTGNRATGWSGGVSVSPSHERYEGRYGNRPYYGGSYRYESRRPIYVNRPAMRYRYYNYYQRPEILVENYAPMAGYYWVAGAWSWDGSEWIWQPGHYEPDPAYSGYDSGYYDGY